jgi:Zn-dependent protease with chaperone function
LDAQSDATDPAYLAAAEMLVNAGPILKLQPPVAEDYFAWYLLGNGLLLRDDAGRAETAFRRSIELDPSFARAYRQLGVAQGLQFNQRGAQESFAAAQDRDPRLPMSYARAQVAKAAYKVDDAFRFLELAVQEEPGRLHIARAAVRASLLLRTRPYAERVGPIVQKFPDDGELICLYALAFVADGNLSQAARQVARARDGGFDPSTVIPAETLTAIANRNSVDPVQSFALALLFFPIAYVAVILAMSAVGVVLSYFTRGTAALALLGNASGDLVQDGRVRRVYRESMLARLYGLALFAGLVFFYLSIPFIVAEVLVITLFCVWILFQPNRLAMHLGMYVGAAGLGMILTVLKSLVVPLGQEPLGVRVMPRRCPELFGIACEVAERINTRPVDDIYISPVAELAVLQQGRGPFGMFGLKSRVMILGLPMMNVLTIDELKSILAHEYAHFSHSDTLYSRFIHQVTGSIEHTLREIGALLGWMNFANPLFWALARYYRAYNMLAAGFSRSREFLADRMACALYGPDVFGRALVRVSIEGPLFEKTVYPNVATLLCEGRLRRNIYQWFSEQREEELESFDRELAYQELLTERTSRFATHPSLRERLEAAGVQPQPEGPVDAPASTLLPELEEKEIELSRLLTIYVARQKQQHAGRRR